ncbi:MAG TPA: hypothetical protein VJ965_11675, partial [Anaerolineales bacterium]|nr:hypothetical protein [Anaerolineales bacterium]
MIVLLVAVPVTTMFLGVRLPAGDALPLPGTPIAPVGPAMMFLAAVPWCLAAGLLGPVHAGLLAFFSGALLAFYDNHNPFIPLVYMLLAMSLSVLFRQRYRTLLFRLLRLPVVAGVLIALVYPLLYGLTTVLVAGGALAVRMDYMLSIVDSAWLAFIGQLVWGILFAQVVAVAMGWRWTGKGELTP